jgi:hypothetical protein
MIPACCKCFEARTNALYLLSAFSLLAIIFASQTSLHRTSGTVRVFIGMLPPDTTSPLSMTASLRASSANLADCDILVFGRVSPMSVGSTTQDVIGSPSSSSPTSICSSRLTMRSPSGPSFMYSTVITMLPPASRLTDNCASAAPVSEVWPRGRFPSRPQW